jgi:hypothetical protein
MEAAVDGGLRSVGQLPSNVEDVNKMDVPQHKSIGSEESHRPVGPLPETNWCAGPWRRLLLGVREGCGWL